MTRATLTVLLVALAACSNDGLAPEVCSDDEGCRYEQCCVSGACVDPGPGGSCNGAALTSSAMTVTPSTIVAGTTTGVRITLRDVHGRAIASAAAEILVQSDCDACDTLESASWVTDANGVVNATFGSTGAGVKQLTLRVGSELAAPVAVTVVPAVAVSVGFATVIDDTRVDSALRGVAVTRLDAFGNPDAIPVNPIIDTLVEIQLDTNAANLVLVDSARATLGSAQRRFVLSQARVPVGGLYVDLVAHRLRLTAFDASPVPLLAASQSNVFDVTSPHMTSDMADSLAVLAGADTELTWTMLPDLPATVVDADATITGAVSPLTYRPQLDSEVPGLSHVVIEPGIALPARDVEVARLGASRTFTPASRAGSQVNITDIRAYADGDLLVLGNFNFDVRMGERNGSEVVVTAFLATGLEAFVARFDPTLTELRWVTLFYGIDETSRPFNAVLRDSDMLDNGDIVALAEFTGGAAAWRNFVIPVVASGGPNAPPVATQCVIGTPTTDGLVTATAARIDGVTGAVEWCTGAHDDGTDTANPISVRAGAVASFSTTSYLALRSTARFKVYKGSVNPAGALAIVHDGAGAGTLVTLGAPIPATESGCTNGVAVLTPIKNGTIDAAWPTLGTGISYDPQTMFLEPANGGVVLGGNGCSGGVNAIELGGTAKVNTASRTDGMLLQVNAQPGAAQGATMSLIWRSGGTNTDRVYVARPFGGDIMVIGDFTVDLPSDSGLLTTPATTLIGGYAARIHRTQHRALWAVPFASPESAVVPLGLSIAGNRIVVAMQATNSMRAGETQHQVIDMNDDQLDIVDLLAELDPEGTVNWSTQILGAQRTSRPLARPAGVTILGINGLQGSIIAGALDATPLRQTNQRGGRGEPLIGSFVPWDFVARDVVQEVP